VNFNSDTGALLLINDKDGNGDASQDLFRADYDDPPPGDPSYPINDEIIA